jgi:integrase
MYEANSKRQLGCPYVFHRNGEPIKDFRFTWDSTCKKTGIKGKLFHDFRRTAIRDMGRSGVPERVAIMVSGHKTRSVFDRYNIVSDQDLREAAKKKQAYHEMQKTITHSPSQKRGEVIPLKQTQGMN